MGAEQPEMKMIAKLTVIRKQVNLKIDENEWYEDT
jgi:hypothetical protein